MKKQSQFSFLACFCLSLTMLFSGCGKDAEPTIITEPAVETQVVMESPAEIPTEPQPVYELQTVYLCVEEFMHNYEGGDFHKGYTYDEYGRPTEYFLIQADGSRGWVTQYSYDENGNLVEERTGDSVNVMTYDEAGHLLSKVSYYKEERNNENHYEYNDLGYVVAETRIERYSQETTYTFTMTYNEDYTEVKIDQYKNGEPNGVTVETYNAAGQVLTSTVYDTNGNWKRTQTWEYDEDGKLLQEGKYSRSETQADYMTIYTYDENGLLLSKNVNYYYGYLLEFTYEPFEILVRVK